MTKPLIAFLDDGVQACVLWKHIIKRLLFQRVSNRAVFWSRLRFHSTSQLEVAFKSTDVEGYIQTQHNLAHFKAKTKTGARPGAQQ